MSTDAQPIAPSELIYALDVIRWRKLTCGHAAMRRSGVAAAA